MIFPKPFLRKQFEVTAEQVTAENMNDIAQWTGGTVKILERGNEPFVEILVQGPHQPDRVAMATIGSWVLKRGFTTRVCSDQAFKANYEPSALFPST